MRLNSHSFKPHPNFLGMGPYHLGVELELEAKDQTGYNDGLAKPAKPNQYYAKRDGSLGSYGWELVTHPISRDFWMGRDDTTKTVTYKGKVWTATKVGSSWMLSGDEVQETHSSLTSAAKRITGYKSISGPRFFRSENPAGQLLNLVDDLRRMGYQSYDTGRCGLHVHVSRKAFGETLENNPAFYWFQRLVNGQMFLKLSQRGEEQMRWCKQRRVSVHDYSHVPHDRYLAVNITSATVEIRIFRGNMLERRIRGAVEAVIAAVEFCKGRTMHPDDSFTNEQVEAAFKSWLAEQPDYSNLKQNLASQEGGA